MALVNCDAGAVATNHIRTNVYTMNEILIFILFITAIIYLSFRLGKERGTLLASERAVDMMIAMGYLKENSNGEIEKVDDESIK